MADMHGKLSTDRWSAATAAALVPARRDAGVMDPDERRAVETAVTRTLVPDVMQALTTSWQGNHATADDDGVEMLVHAVTLVPGPRHQPRRNGCTAREARRGDQPGHRPHP